MKKIIIGLVLLTLTSCIKAEDNWVNEITVVQKITTSEDIKKRSDRKYSIQTNRFIFYSDSTYNVGDTLIIRKK